jgi:hypothetical protein
MSTEKTASSAHTWEQEIHAAFIKQNWREIASLAWRGYNDLGRGYVYVDLKNHALIFADRIEVPQHTPLLYANNEAFRAQMDVYRPETEVIIVFSMLNRNTTYALYRICEKPSPPSAGDQ